jgi:hypothetical protein
MTLDDLLRPHDVGFWARFLGSYLPARTLRLRFDCLTPRRRCPRSLVRLGQIEALYAAQGENRQAVLTTVREHLRAVNRCQLTAPSRFALAELALAAIAGPVRDLEAELIAGRGGVPEEDWRRQWLELIVATLRVLLTAYQLVLASDYGQDRFRYARARARVHRCAHRVIEVIVMIQQARALRYQRLEGDLWRIANTVYRVMLDYEQVDIPLATAGALLRGQRDRSPHSIHDLYVMLQAPALLDFLTWPEGLLAFALDYCRLTPEGMLILPSDGTPVGDFQALTGCYHDDEPVNTRLSELVGPALLIDYDVLARQARTDLEALRAVRTLRDAAQLPRCFQQMHPAEMLDAAYLMAGLANRRAPPAWTASGRRPEDRDLRIHAGFDDVYDHLLAVFDPTGRAAAKRELANLFARRSAAIGEDHTATEASLWHVLHEAPGRLRLHTQETRFTQRLTIGLFLAFGVGEEGIRRPELGKVIRIHRPETGWVQVDLAIIADYVRPGAVCPGDATPAARQAGAVRALLTYTDDAGWGLLLADNVRIWEGTRVSLVGTAKEASLPVGELRDLGAGYCLFRLKATLDGRARPHYPAVPMATVTPETDSTMLPAATS